jgi:hypothetical protein
MCFSAPERTQHEPCSLLLPDLSLSEHLLFTQWEPILDPKPNSAALSLSEHLLFTQWEPILDPKPNSAALSCYGQNPALALPGTSTPPLCFLNEPPKSYNQQLIVYSLLLLYISVI